MYIEIINHTFKDISKLVSIEFAAVSFYEISLIQLFQSIWHFWWRILFLFSNGQRYHAYRRIFSTFMSDISRFLSFLHSSTKEHHIVTCHVIALFSAPVDLDMAELNHMITTKNETLPPSWNEIHNGCCELSVVKLTY